MTDEPTVKIRVSTLERLINRSLEVEQLAQQAIQAKALCGLIDSLEELGILKPDASFEDFEAIMAALESGKPQENAEKPKNRPIEQLAGWIGGLR